ncbi:MAG: hypothetical protein HQ553_17700 [Chloroflexi bacterium]|nr:hypothetical protein [Chloroflexota bacterium]
MLARIMIQKLSGSQKGITGLETAIILIAFVVVAAVFAYTVLSAGLFATGKSSETVYSGLEATQSTMQLSGPVYAYDTDDNDYVDKIEFVVKVVQGGEAMDFTAGTPATSANKVVIAYSGSQEYKEELAWSRTAVGAGDGDNMLEENESFRITLDNLETGTVNGLTGNLARKHQFILEVKPGGGATLVIERRLPKKIDPVMNLN